VVRTGSLARGLALTAGGCSSLLGFKEGSLIDDPAPSCDAACDAEGGTGTAAGPVEITAFDGAADSLVVSNGYVYFTHGNDVWGCSTTQPCPAPVSIFTDGTQTRALALFGNRIAWAHPLGGKLRECFARMLEPCSTTMGFDEPAIEAIAPDLEGDLFWLRANASADATELRLLSSHGFAPATVGSVRGTSPKAALAPVSPQLSFVMVGGAAYSISTPIDPDAGPPTVAPLVADPVPAPDAAPVATAIVTASGRVVWPRGRSTGLWQCPIDETRSAPCDESKVTQLASAGEDVTALGATGDMVVWARRAQNFTDVLACTVTFGSAAATCEPRVVAGAIDGLVSALTVDSSGIGRPNGGVGSVYFLVSETSGRQRLERAPVP
jgi:hypothetical protein